MKKALIGMMLLGGSLLAAPSVRFGVQFGAPAPVVVTRPACPGPGYTWVNGYYQSDGDWIAGYWAPPAVVRVAPRVDFDHDRGRDFDRDRGRANFQDRDHDRGRDEHFRR